jgi:hypothetical protein
MKLTQTHYQKAICHVKPTDTQLNVISELSLDEETVVSMSCTQLTSQRYIVFTSLEKLILVKYDAQFNMSILDSQQLFSNTSSRGRKPASAVFVNGTSWIVTSNDRNDLLVYCVTDNKLTLLHTVITQEETKEAVSDTFKELDIRVDDSQIYIAAVTNSGHFRVWRVKHNNKKKFSSTVLQIKSSSPTLREKHRFCKFSLISPNLVYTMFTSKAGPTFVMVYNVKDVNSVEKKIEVIKSYCTDFGITHELESKARKKHQMKKVSKEFLSFGNKSGLILTQVLFENNEVKAIVKAGEFHGAHVDPVTCNDLLLTQEVVQLTKKQQQQQQQPETQTLLKIASGSLDRSVGFTHINLSDQQGFVKNLGLVLFVLVLSVSIIVTILKSLLVDKLNSNTTV